MTKRIFALLFAVIMIFSVSVVAFSADTTVGGYVDDSADLLSSSEEAQLTAKLNELSTKYNADFVIVTTPDLYNATFSFDGTTQDYADRYFETQGFSADGVLVLLTLSNEYGSRRAHISTAGTMISKLSSSEIDTALDVAVDSNNPDQYGYYQFFAAMLDSIDSSIAPHVGPGSIFIALVAALVVAIIVVLIMKSQLKSVKMASGAKDYIRQGSLNVTASRDTFLYNTVSRTARPKDSGGSGGSHTSSGGVSHGGGGRSF